MVVAVIFVAYIGWQFLVTISNFSPIRNYPPNNKKIIVFSTSVASTTHNEWTSAGYAAVLAERLGAEIEIAYVLKGTLASLQEVIAVTMVSKHPGIIVIELDRAALSSINRSPTERQILEKAVAIAQQQKAVVLLLGIPSDAETHEAMLRAFAKKNGCLVVPDITLLGRGAVESSSTPSVNIKVADVIAPTLESVLLTE
jgi:hypothetical protein